MAEETYSPGPVTRQGYPENVDITTEGTDEESVTDQASKTARRAKQRLNETGRQAVAKIDEQREPMASGLESAAASLHETAEKLPGGQNIARAAHATAGKIEDTARYVREHDVRAMMDDVEDLVRSHPAQSLLAAAAVGFLVGRLFRSDE